MITRKISKIIRKISKIIRKISKIIRKISKIFYVRKNLPEEPLENWVVQQIKFDDISNRYYTFQKKQITNTSIKIICHYLPQFHPFKENNDWWGHGFTEWTNVVKATRKFSQHRQPRRPKHLGYYDLRTPETMAEQAALAKNYGIYGFSYYFYWFDGKTLMEEPLKKMLENKSIDIPFCLNWANENWTRRWDGAADDILIAQNHCMEDSIKFIEYVMNYFRDERYIRVANKPVLMVYRCDIIPDIKKVTEIWREKCISAGFKGLYLIAVKSFDINTAKKYGFDAVSDFPPHTVHPRHKPEIVKNLAKNSSCHIYDYNDAVVEAVREDHSNEKTFPCVMLEWDNTARRNNNASIFTNFKLVQYKQWLSYSCNRVLHDNKISENEQFVFVNAWNEWAEGTYLEPDEEFGCGYLEATSSVIKNYAINSEEILRFNNRNKFHDSAIICHIHYEEIWNEIALKLNCLEKKYDLYITSTSLDILKVVKSKYPSAETMLVDNRGRDILPFILTLTHIIDFGYDAVCKIHGKKSEYRNDGEKIRVGLFNVLLGLEKDILDIFNKNSLTGIVIPKLSILEHNHSNMASNWKNVNLIKKITNVNYTPYFFPAGSMFWFKPDALKQIVEILPNYFDIEYGASDGTLPHAVERYFAIFASHNGYHVYDQTGIRYNRK